LQILLETDERQRREMRMEEIELMMIAQAVVDDS
jgi:hypothetical protein